MKFKSLILTAALLTGCSYKVMGDKNVDPKLSHVHTKTSCSYTPLWLAPLNSDYADVEKIAAGGKVLSVEQKVYPFVLFTKFCTIVKYTH